MEGWGNPGARVDTLVLMSSRAEVEAGDVADAAVALCKLMRPENAPRLKGRLIFGIDGYDDDSRELYEIPEVRGWMRALDHEFPYWFYFMDLGRQSTLSLVTFSLCAFRKVQGGKWIHPGELQAFIAVHYDAMNRLAATLGESQAEIDERSRQISNFYFPELESRG